jgi:hypothetical protein
MILATNSRPPRVAPNDTDILFGKRNENNVSPIDATNSRLLRGVTGGTTLRSFLRRQKGIFAATGTPQM